MNHDPREQAAAESYSTFWEDAPRAPSQQLVYGQDAYTTFVNLCEDEFVSEWQLFALNDQDAD